VEGALTTHQPSMAASFAVLARRVVAAAAGKRESSPPATRLAAALPGGLDWR
jgi:hypothetical protein